LNIVYYMKPNKYHILVYRDGSRIYYHPYETIEELYEAYREYTRLDEEGYDNNEDYETEWAVFKSDMDSTGYYWCETYNSKESITSVFSIGELNYNGIYGDSLKTIESMIHKNLHLELEKYIKRNESLKHLLS